MQRTLLTWRRQQIWSALGFKSLALQRLKTQSTDLHAKSIRIMPYGLAAAADTSSCRAQAAKAKTHGHSGICWSSGAGTSAPAPPCCLQSLAYCLLYTCMWMDLPDSPQLTSAVQLVNACFYVIPNAYIIAQWAHCVWFEMLINASGFLRWTCWNTVGSLARLTLPGRLEHLVRNAGVSAVDTDTCNPCILHHRQLLACMPQ